MIQRVSSSHQMSKDWSFSFRINSSNQSLGLISFRIDWFDLLAVQGNLKRLFRHPSLKALVLWCSVFFMVQFHIHTCRNKQFSFILGEAGANHSADGRLVLRSVIVFHCVLVAHSCPTLCDPIDCSPPGTLQARILEWVAISFSSFPLLTTKLL